MQSQIKTVENEIEISKQNLIKIKELKNNLITQIKPYLGKVFNNLLKQNDKESIIKMKNIILDFQDEFDNLYIHI